MQILNDIHHHRIQIFQPPLYENEDEETIAENEEILVGSRDQGTTMFEDAN